MAIAESRLCSPQQKFQRDPELENRYRMVMQEYIHQGYARKLMDNEARMTMPKSNYLPHHAVINRNKPGKVRVIFEAVAKYQGTSFNQNHLQDPDMTNNLMAC